MENEKSPGEYGPTKEFYVTLLDIFKAELCKLFNNKSMIFNVIPKMYIHGASTLQKCIYMVPLVYRMCF